MSEKDKKEVEKMFRRYTLYTFILVLAGDFNYFMSYMDLLEEKYGKISK